MTYENEIPKELEVGETYTSKDMVNFVAFNDVIVMCEQANRFAEWSEEKFVVQNRFESFLHKNENRSTYQIPSKKNRVYIVRKI